MTDIYQENIINHYKHPRNFGEPKNYTHKLPGANLSCGDEICWFLTIKDNYIEDVKFSSQACTICTASCSILSDQIKNKSLNELKIINTNNIKNNIGIPLSAVRLKCALLPLLALKDLKKG